MNNSVLATTLILTMLFLILSSLGLGLYFLVKDQGQSKRTVRALTVRITLSIILFLALIIAFAVGWLRPHGL